MDGKSKEVREAEEYYERIRQQQKADGTYDPNLNGNISPEDQHFDRQNIIETKKQGNFVNSLYSKNGQYIGIPWD